MTFGQILDHERQKDILRRAIRSGRLAQIALDQEELGEVRPALGDAGQNPMLLRNNFV